MTTDAIELPASTERNDGGQIIGTRYFRTVEEAEAAKTKFLNSYGWPGYDGRASVTPPNADRPYAMLDTRRWHSCD
jgi:hypothetical protein